MAGVPSQPEAAKKAVSPKVRMAQREGRKSGAAVGRGAGARTAGLLFPETRPGPLGQRLVA